jgi:hypothetical protein
MQKMIESLRRHWRISQIAYEIKRQTKWRPTLKQQYQYCSAIYDNWLQYESKWDDGFDASAIAAEEISCWEY